MYLQHGGGGTDDQEGGREDAQEGQGWWVWLVGGVLEGGAFIYELYQ